MRTALLACLLIACKSASDGAGGASPEPAAQPAAPADTAEAVAPAEPEPTSQPASDDGYEASTPSAQPDGSALYGEAFDPEVQQVALTDLLGAPERYADATVRTSGVVSRVCANMGCWMELRDEKSGEEVRAPLAGHSYFLPQSAAGQRADVQGIVNLQPLTDEQKAHLEAEGAKATGSRVRIIATGVALKGQGPEQQERAL